MFTSYLLIVLHGVIAPAATSTGGPRYPSDDQMNASCADANAIGASACSDDPFTTNSDVCKDYIDYWRTADYNHQVRAPTTSTTNPFPGKLLIISVGQSFRGGGHKTFINGTQASIDGQHSAVMSHLALTRYLKYRYNISSDFIVNTYHSDHDTLLQSWYPPNTSFMFGSMDTTISAKEAYEKFLDTSWNATELSRSEYGGVLFLRVDIFLKPGFFHFFDPFKAKLVFPFIVTNAENGVPLKWVDGTPLVGDITFFAPRSLFHLFDKDGVKLFHDVYSEYPPDDIYFMVNTYHDANSQKASNPLYYIVNRPISTVARQVSSNYDDFDGNWVAINGAWTSQLPKFLSILILTFGALTY
jgi:hypothetical protein